jgi:O-antigen biosynthesis protein
VTTHAGFAATSTASSPEYEASNDAAFDRVMPGIAAREPALEANGAASLTAAVVICAYTQRRWAEIGRAVRSVMAQETRPEQVLLVVDHNELLLHRARVAFPEVTVVPSAGPPGLSGARNTAIGHVRADVLAFLDDDAEAEPDWLTRLLAHYDSPAVLAVGGRAIPTWEHARPPWLPPEFDWVVGCSFTGQPSEAAPVRNLIGCNMSFRRTALERTAGFDPALGRVGKVPVGCEETELCIRVGRQNPGAVVLYEPAARVRHRVTADRATWRYFRRRCLAEGRSKAVVTRLAGAQAGLSSEREYTRRVLPAGVRRELRDTGRGDHGAALRAGAIVAGLAFTASAYLTARVRGVTTTGATTVTPRPPRGPGPVRVLDVELSEGVPAVADGGRPDGGRYGMARVLVRLHDQAIGVLDVALPPGGLTADAHAELIGCELAGEIEAHLRQDGLPAADALTSAGVDAARPCTPATDKVPFVSVVVPTCGRTETLRRTLGGLGGLDYPRYEIVVVDNAPHRPETAALVAEHAAAGLPVRYTSEPRPGVTHARNRGLSHARGTLVAFADDDVVVDRNWLRALVGGFTDEAVVAVTGSVLAGELETPAQVWVEQYGGFGKGCARRRFDVTGYDVCEPGRVRRVPAGTDSLYPYLPGTYGSGANMAFRTDVLRRIGGFDPVLGSRGAVRAGEDIDVLLRIVLAGHVLVYEPSAIVWHTHKREYRALRRTMHDYGSALSAVLVKCLMTHPAGRRELLRRVPRGIAYAVRPGSAKNARKENAYPFSLTAGEMWGMAFGPARYACGALAARLEAGRR